MHIEYPKKPVVFIMGPTASGKTELAIRLYQLAAVELISVDSAMVYRGMDIGSAKPSAEELARAPHHLIDIRDPAEAYSAADFRHDAIELINQAHAKGRTPVLVGGTMLYFKTLRDGLADLPAANPEIRRQLNDELLTKGIEALHAQLSEVDPVTAARLKTTDTQRVLRALEVYRATAKPLSQWHSEQRLNALPNPLLSIGLVPSDRAVLHRRIALRFQQMMERGFLDEVKQLYQRDDLNIDLPSIKCVGYRQLWQHLDGVLSIEEAIERGIIATRQLAKRQFTWLRSWQDLTIFDALNRNELANAQRQVLKFVRG